MSNLRAYFNRNLVYLPRFKNPSCWYVSLHEVVESGNLMDKIDFVEEMVEIEKKKGPNSYLNC